MLRLPMKLVTYLTEDRRRLGAVLSEEVIDLAAAVGHPAFPSTLESLVSRCRGTVMDAARDALERSDADRWIVKNAKLVAPLLPRSLVAPGALDVERVVVGPGDTVDWPDGAGWLDYQPMVAAVLGSAVERGSVAESRRSVFGYTLVSDWKAHSSDGAALSTGAALPIAIGPCVVTADELDPHEILVQVKLDSQAVAEGVMNGAATGLFKLIADTSKTAPLERGDALAVTPFPNAPDVHPGALVEVLAEGIGTLRNHIGAPD